jgi:N-acetylneuraminic acid mutarotase
MRATLLFALGMSGGPVRLYPVEPAEPGPQQRSYHAAAVVNGKIYVIGGAGPDNKPVPSVHVYDPATGTWAALASMPTARALFGAAAVGGTIYAVGGTTIGLDKVASHMTVSAVGGKIDAIGGGLPPRSRGGPKLLPVLEVYDTGTNRWTTAADPPTPRGVLSSSVVDGRIYVMGGAVSSGATREEFLRTTHTVSVVEVYDPANGRWTRGRD